MLSDIMFCFSVTMLIIILLICIIGPIAYIIFMFRYGEEVRSVILNLPGYKSSRFNLVDFSKPTKPWDVIGAFFFVDRIKGAVFAKKTTPMNEIFKSRLSKKIISSLKHIRWLNYSAIILIFCYGFIFYLQQHGYFN